MALTLKRILVPIDFEDGSLKAKDYADQLALVTGAEVELFHVVVKSPYEVYQQRGFLADVPLYQRPNDAMPAADQKYVIRDVVEETRQQLKRLVTASSGVSYRTEVSHGDAVDEIVAEIGRYQPDLVVISTHGRRGLTHLVMGSVAEKVVRMSPVPVLALPMKAAA